VRLVLDVSNKNPIPRADLKAAGAEALIAKATEGTSFEDATLPTHRAMAASLKIVFGSYLYLHHDSPGSEAAYYLAYATPQPGDLQPIVDAEDLSGGVAALAHRALTCLNSLQAHGYRPLLYASSSVWLEMIVHEPNLKRFRVWEAQYPGRFSRWLPRLAQLRVRLRHGVTVVLWQWTDAYLVNGHRYDASRLLAQLSDLQIQA
jgi:GH25 family lysozyme M1 (1,4-beta-N-acetylmuramidase)